MSALQIEAGEARELPADEAWRELFDTFYVLTDDATQPMPLDLEPLPEETFKARVRRVLGGGRVSARADAALRRKLHAWELEHLRRVVAEQADRIEALEADNASLRRSLSYAEDLADSWRDDALRAIEDAGCAPGLTMDGRLLCVAPGAAQ